MADIPKKIRCELCGNVSKKIRRHHLVPRKNGCYAISNNRVNLCRACERKLHKAEQKGFVVMPQMVDGLTEVKKNSEGKWVYIIDGYPHEFYCEVGFRILPMCMGR